MKDIHGEEWQDVENNLRRQWLNSNNDPSLVWEDVREIVKFGWTNSKNEESRESIH